MTPETEKNLRTYGPYIAAGIIAGTAASFVPRPLPHSILLFFFDVFFFGYCGWLLFKIRKMHRSAKKMLGEIDQLLARMRSELEITGEGQKPKATIQ